MFLLFAAPFFGTICVMLLACQAQMSSCKDHSKSESCFVSFHWEICPITMMALNKCIVFYSDGLGHHRWSDSASKVTVIEYIWQYYVNVLWFVFFYAVILSKWRLESPARKETSHYPFTCEDWHREICCLRKASPPLKQPPPVLDR